MASEKKETAGEKKDQVRVRIQLLGGGFRWVDQDLLERLREVTQEFIAQSGAIGFTAWEVREVEEQVRDIFIDMAAKP